MGHEFEMYEITALTLAAAVLVVVAPDPTAPPCFVALAAVALAAAALAVVAPDPTAPPCLVPLAAAVISVVAPDPTAPPRVARTLTRFGLV